MDITSYDRDCAYAFVNSRIPEHKFPLLSLLL